MSGVLNDGGHEAEAESGGVDLQQVVLGLNLGHDLGLAPPFPVSHDVRTSPRARLERVLRLNHSKKLTTTADCETANRCFIRLLVGRGAV